MYRLLVILTFIGTFTYSSLATESRIRVKNGVYKRLTVAIEESVDSRLCFQTLNKIEVSSFAHAIKSKRLKCALIDPIGH